LCWVPAGVGIETFRTIQTRIHQKGREDELVGEIRQRAREQSEGVREEDQGRMDVKRATRKWLVELSKMERRMHAVYL